MVSSVRVRLLIGAVAVARYQGLAPALEGGLTVSQEESPNSDVPSNRSRRSSQCLGDAQQCPCCHDHTDRYNHIDRCNGGTEMKRRLSAVEARKSFGEVLDGVYYRGDEVVIERAGKPLAVVVPVKLYEQQLEQREAAWDRLLTKNDRGRRTQ